jgi:hypothetical protein
MLKTQFTFISFISFIFFSIHCYPQASKLKPDFIKEEFLELLKVSSRQGDSLYNPNLPAPEKFTRVYRSPEMGLDNRWDLWVSADSLVCISIRGTTKKQVSWLDNFYAAMVPASGTMKLSRDYEFNYHLSDDSRAAVHTGWLIATAFLSKDIKPKIDSLYQVGYSQYYIMGHSQGGAISYLLTALLLKEQQKGSIPDDIKFKTYCSAAPKPGNLYFAYDFENMAKGGWALTVNNAADWVPQAPFSIQTVEDFVELSPFANVKEVMKKQPLLKRVVMKKVYNKLDKPTKKASNKFQHYLGQKMEVFIREVLPEYEAPDYVNSNNYVRTGNQVVLYPSDEYYEIFHQDKNNIWINHMFEAYLYLTAQY